MKFTSLIFSISRCTPIAPLLKVECNTKMYADTQSVCEAKPPENHLGIALAKFESPWKGRNIQGE